MEECLCCNQKPKSLKDYRYAKITKVEALDIPKVISSNRGYNEDEVITKVPFGIDWFAYQIDNPNIPQHILSSSRLSGKKDFRFEGKAYRKFIDKNNKTRWSFFKDFTDCANEIMNLDPIKQKINYMKCLENKVIDVNKFFGEGNENKEKRKESNNDLKYVVYLDYNRENTNSLTEFYIALFISDSRYFSTDIDILKVNYKGILNIPTESNIAYNG